MRIRIRDPEPFLTLDQGSGMEKLGLGINHPGSAPLKSTFFFIREGQEVAVQQVGQGGQKPRPAQPLQAVHNKEIYMTNKSCHQCFESRSGSALHKNIVKNLCIVYIYSGCIKFLTFFLFILSQADDQRK